MGTVQPVLAWIKMDVKPLMMMMMSGQTRTVSIQNGEEREVNW
mgnify:CR=1 FL=1